MFCESSGSCISRHRKKWRRRCCCTDVLSPLVSSCRVHRLAPKANRPPFSLPHAAPQKSAAFQADTPPSFLGELQPLWQAYITRVPCLFQGFGRGPAASLAAGVVVSKAQGEATNCNPCVRVYKHACHTYKCTRRTRTHARTHAHEAQVPRVCDGQPAVEELVELVNAPLAPSSTHDLHVSCYSCQLASSTHTPQLPSSSYVNSYTPQRLHPHHSDPLGPPPSC
jgi:hypothetical protein